MNSQWRAVRFNGEFRDYQQRILDYADQYFADGHVHIVAPITMFGRPRWSGPGRRFRYDFPALSSMIRGVLSPGTGTPDDR